MLIGKRNILLLIFMIVLGSCRTTQSKTTASDYWTPKIITDTRRYKTVITAMRKGFWKDYVKQFPTQLSPGNDYSLSFFPGFLQGGPFIFPQIQFKTEKQAQKYFDNKSVNYQLQFPSIDSLKQADYCDPGIPDSLFKQDCLIRTFDNFVCFTDDSTVILGGVLSGIAINHKRKIVFCWAEDERL
ncbi:MAG: hypothetical protein JWO06_3536 [Bacteroidota bacterium]|nr:hypothetical protein [Bacteroidota bacterium]